MVWTTTTVSVCHPPEIQRTPVGVRRLHHDILDDVAEVAGPRKVADFLHEADGGEEEPFPFTVVSFWEKSWHGRGRPDDDAEPYVVCVLLGDVAPALDP